MANDNPLLLSINRADTGTLFGNAASASLGINNLKERQITKKWRSPDAAPANTWFACDFGTDRIIDAVCLIAHNLSQSSQWRLRLFNGAYREWNLLGPKIPTDLTLTRASTGYYFDKDGLFKLAGNNDPRFEYDALTLQPLGLLNETAATNLALRSSTFDDAYWVKNATSVTANAFESPDGTTSADILLETAVSGEHYAETGAITTAASQWYTASVFVNPVSRVFVRLFFMDTGGINGGFATFDLGLGTVVSATTLGAGPFAKGRIIRYRNGWYRIAIRTQHAGTSSKVRLQILNDVQGTNYIGDITKGVRVWEAQCELGFKPTSPITTEGATATRAADELVTTAPAAVWNAAGGAFVVEARHRSPEEAENKQIISFSDGTANERIDASVTSSGGIVVNVSDNGISQAILSIATPVNADQNFRVAVGYGVNDFVAVLNENVPVTDLSGSVPTITQLQIGPFDGHVRFVSYWADRPALELLQAVNVLAYNFLTSPDPTAVYDSGPLLAWPVVGGFGVLPWGQFLWGNALPPDEAGLYTISSYHVIDPQRSGQNLFVNIYDETNTALYVEAGRLMVGPAWRPSYGMLYGWEIWFEDDSQIDQSLGGQDYADEVPRYRVCRFELDQIDDVEIYANAFDFIDRRKGVVGDIVVIPQPSRPELFIHEAMYGRCRMLHPIRHPTFAGRSKVFEIKELL